MLKTIGIIVFFILVPFGMVDAQPNQANKKISIDDLKPEISYSQSDSFYQPVKEKPGWALLSSVVIPGSGQAANSKWTRAGLYLLAEAVIVGIHIKSYNDAKAEQERYERFADNNWSVVTYAQWLVAYHEQNDLSNPNIDDLREQVASESANHNPQEDWQKVDIELLRKVEENTPFVYPEHVGNDFSHIMPEYGSQQYYELISKYYQYGPGWNDFDAKYELNWDGSGMPRNFLLGADMAEDFNSSYRLAGNMVSFLILNHIVSAFDAFLTVKIKNKKLEADSNLLNPHRTFSFKFHF